MPQLYSRGKYTQKRITLRMQVFLTAQQRELANMLVDTTLLHLLCYAIATLPCGRPSNNKLFCMPEQLRIDASKPMHENASIALVLNHRSLID